MYSKCALNIHVVGVVVRSLMMYLISVTALAQVRPAKFANVVTFDSGGVLTESLAVGDVNGDGKLDVVVTNARSNSVGVLLGNGDGTFQPVAVYPSGGDWPLTVTIADLNGDGKLDIVEVSELSNSVSVLMGNGDGTLQSPVTYTPGGYGMAVGDLNRDGKPDIVVVDFGGGSVLLGNGDGTFRQGVSYNAGGNRAAIADLNSDGKLDVIVSDSQSGTIAVLMGNGDGTFQPPTFYGLGGYYLTHVAIGDVNGDGTPDLVLTNCYDFSLCAGSVSVLFGNGDGTFQTPSNYDTHGFFPSSVKIGDVNGDGKPDLVVANNCDDQMCSRQREGGVALLLGHGDGTFGTAARLSGGATYTNDVVVADVNGDRMPDLVIANLFASPDNQEGSVGVLLNLAKPSCTAAPVVMLSITQTQLWPPNGKMVPVTASGTITESQVACTLKSAAYDVTDEYGAVQPSGPVIVGAGGAYSFTVLLEAARLGSDLDGRSYRLTVSASNNTGATGSAASTVIVPHDQGH